MRRTILAIVMAMMTIASFAKKEQTPVQQWGQLKVVGTQLCDQNGNAITLRGASLGWHNLWPRFYNAKAVKWLADDWNAKVIRAAMGIMIEDNYLENPGFALDCIEPVVKAAIKEGVYVIIDWHSHVLKKKEAVEFFGKMAKKYGQHPNVIYEIYNEPDNLILVGCPHWDQDIHLVAESPLEGYNNIMYTVHFYAGTHKQWLRDRIDAAMQKGVPVFISECASMDASGDGKLDKDSWNEWVDYMEAKKISWVCWSVSDKNETCSMLLPRAKATGNWTKDLIKPWGKIVRETLREK